MRLPSHRTAEVALTALLIPVLWIGVDLGLRGALFSSAGAALQSTYAAGILLSLLVWGFAMEAARHPHPLVRTAAVSFVGFIAAFGIGLQSFARALTHAYVGRRAVMLALGVPDLAHAGYFARNALMIGGFCLLPAILAVSLARFRRRRFGRLRLRPSAAAGGAAAAVLLCMFTPFAAQGLQGLPPDVLLLHGTGGPLLHAMGVLGAPRSLPRGERAVLPATTRVDEDAPSIVLVLGESVRRDAVCAARAQGCALSPRVDDAAPDRIGFSRAFSVASCTELVSAALWTGLPITAAPPALAKAPLLWDYAHARGYRTAYLTSQNLLYQQGDLFLQTSAIDALREGRDRAADARVDEGSPDEDTTAEALDFIEAGGPAFVVVHYSNTHTPYRQAAGFTPLPTDGADAAHNRYRNSLAHNDAILGDLVARLRRAAPARPVSTGDLAATLLDLTGALDEPAFREPLAALAGASLLRAEGGPRAALLWNCPLTRECPADAFGIVEWPLKLHYVGHEGIYACHDLEADPGERAPLPPVRCQALRARLDRSFGASGLSPSER